MSSLQLRCQVADLALSTYHYTKQRSNSLRYLTERQLICEIFDKSRGRYGYRRIASVLKHEQGLCLSGKTVLKLMREEGCVCKVRARKYSSYKGGIGRIAPNLLQRDFVATSPNQKWVTDVTEFNVLGSKVYLSPMMDLYNKEIVAYTVGTSPNMNLIQNMLKQATARLGCDDQVIIHSDQGWQYQQKAYQYVLKECGISQSMSRKANCLDNACAEGFFSHLKAELYHQHRYLTPEELIDDIHAYIKWYNTERIQLKLKGLSPVDYRTQSQNAA